MKKIIQKVLNTESDGTCMTLTTSHHYAGNITHPRGGIARRAFWWSIGYDIANLSLFRQQKVVNSPLKIRLKTS